MLLNGRDWKVFEHMENGTEELHTTAFFGVPYRALKARTTATATATRTPQNNRFDEH